ncbi:alpha/beta fold hydrolase [Variovorax ginsengisoli]|nr:alpha/beta fold hydrolase [Variovorax ginsengisoli]
MRSSTMIDANVEHPGPEQIAHAFLTPRLPPQRLPLLLDGGEALRIATLEGEAALQRAGSGPAVLLLHGWEGHKPPIWLPSRPPLLDAGFSVLAMDLPAHGDSAGRQTSISQSARALGAVGEALEPSHAVIAHSIGSAVLAEALHAGLAAQRAVLVSAPAHYERYARGFAAAAGLDRTATEVMLALLRSAVGVDVREKSLLRRAPQLRQRALFIHSTDDRVVAIEDSLPGASAWPGPRHLRVEGLGHRPLLGNPAVVAAAIDFVATTH